MSTTAPSTTTRRFACGVCGIAFSKHDKLQRHLLTAHKGELRLETSHDHGENLEVQRVLRKAIRKANRVFGTAREGICDMCQEGRLFRNAMDLAQHLVVKHENEMKADDSRKGSQVSGTGKGAKLIVEQTLNTQEPQGMHQAMHLNVGKHKATNVVDHNLKPNTSNNIAPNVSGDRMEVSPNLAANRTESIVEPNTVPPKLNENPNPNPTDITPITKGAEKADTMEISPKPKDAKGKEKKKKDKKKDSKKSKKKKKDKKDSTKETKDATKPSKSEKRKRDPDLVKHEDEPAIKKPRNSVQAVDPKMSATKPPKTPKKKRKTSKLSALPQERTVKLPHIPWFKPAPVLDFSCFADVEALTDRPYYHLVER